MIRKDHQPTAQHGQTRAIDTHDGANRRLSRWADIRVLSASSVLGLGAVTLIAWLLLPLSSSIVPFVVTTALPLFTLFVVFYQAIVYRRQWNAMLAAMSQTDLVIDKMQQQLEAAKTTLAIETAKTDPRLRIEDVRAVNFDPGKQPIFIVTVINDGLIPARDVAFEMKVSMGDKEERSDDKFDVPAHEAETPFLISHGVLDETQIESFNANAPLVITGSLSYFPYQRKEGDPPQEFCYKYFPWKGERPTGIPQFVRCSRRAGSDITVYLGTGQFKGTGQAPTMVQDKSNQITPSGDVTNVVIHDNAPNEPQASVEKKEASKEKSDEAN